MITIQKSAGINLIENQTSTDILRETKNLHNSMHTLIQELTRIANAPEKLDVALTCGNLTLKIKEQQNLIENNFRQFKNILMAIYHYGHTSDEDLKNIIETIKKINEKIDNIENSQQKQNEVITSIQAQINSIQDTLKTILDKLNTNI